MGRVSRDRRRAGHPSYSGILRFRAIRKPMIRWRDGRSVRSCPTSGMSKRTRTRSRRSSANSVGQTSRSSSGCLPLNRPQSRRIKGWTTISAKKPGSILGSARKRRAEYEYPDRACCHGRVGQDCRTDARRPDRERDHRCQMVCKEQRGACMEVLP